MNVRIIAVLAVIGLSLAALGVVAQDGRHNPERAFAHLDADGNGEITEEEFAAAEPLHHRKRAHMGRPGMDNKPTAEQQAVHQQALFEALDADGDGCVSSDEFAALHEIRRALMKEHMFQRMDRNGDGVITPDELPSRGGDVPEE
jgi:Ca2+-binding EF-hand superfamily protein